MRHLPAVLFSATSKQPPRIPVLQYSSSLAYMVRTIIPAETPVCARPLTHIYTFFSQCELQATFEQLSVPVILAFSRGQPYVQAAWATLVLLLQVILLFYALTGTLLAHSWLSKL